MLAKIVGSVDQYSALVLVALCICLCIVFTSLIVKRSRTDISNEFELAKMKQQGESARAQFIAETSRAVEFKKTDQGLITSHVREN